MVQMSNNSNTVSLPLHPNALRSLIEHGGYSFREVSEVSRFCPQGGHFAPNVEQHSHE